MNNTDYNPNTQEAPSIRWRPIDSFFGGHKAITGKGSLACVDRWLVPHHLEDEYHADLKNAGILPTDDRECIFRYRWLQDHQIPIQVEHLVKDTKTELEKTLQLFPTARALHTPAEHYALLHGDQMATVWVWDAIASKENNEEKFAAYTNNLDIDRKIKTLAAKMVNDIYSGDAEKTAEYFRQEDDIYNDLVIQFPKATMYRSKSAWSSFTHSSTKRADHPDQQNLSVSVKRKLSDLTGKMGIYFTPNEFKGWRKEKNLFSLRSLYVDIDGNTDLCSVLDLLDENAVPHPSMVVYSGNGLHLYWFINPVPAKALPAWKLGEQYLIKILKPLGADPSVSDGSRVLRLIGTTNEKNQQVVRGVLFDDYRWPLSTLVTEMTGKERRSAPPAAAKKRRRTKKIKNQKNVSGSSIYQRWRIVSNDLDRIAEYHNHSIPVGFRDIWLFLKTVALSWYTPYHHLQRQVLLSAHKSVPDISDAEVIATMQTAIRKAGQSASISGKTGTCSYAEDCRYKYTSNKLYELLQGIIPEEIFVDLRGILPEHVRLQRRKEMSRQRDCSRDRVAEGRYSAHNTGLGYRDNNRGKVAEALKMHESGESYRKIASTLSVSLSTIAKWCSATKNTKKTRENLSHIMNNQQEQLESTKKTDCNFGVFTFRPVLNKPRGVVGAAVEHLRCEDQLPRTASKVGNLPQRLQVERGYG